MGIYWYAMNYNNMTYFEAPSKFGYNKGEYVHNPNNPFSHMFIYMNEKDEGLFEFDTYELKCDQYQDILMGKEWKDYKNITEDVYKEYVDFWKEREDINNNLFKHYNSLTKSEKEFIQSLPEENKYIRDKPIESNGKPIDPPKKEKE